MDAKRGFWTEIGFLDFVVSVCALIVFCLFGFKFFKRSSCINASAKETTSIHPNFGRCKYPDCVRCRRHKSVLMRARTKLTYYCQDENNCAKSASCQLLEDVQGSYKNLTSDVVEQVTRRNCQNPLIFKLKGIRAQAVWSLEEFPGIVALVDQCEGIRAEINELICNSEHNGQLNASSYWKVNDTPTGRWSICHLVDQGVETQAVTACPITWNVVSSLHCIMKSNLFGNVAFSVVEPGTKIEAHFGPTNIRIRCHLGLHIPRNCHLTVADKKLEWTENGLLCFDDSYLHHVEFLSTRNNNQKRIVLMVDLWHPDITMEQKSLIDYSFSPES